MIKLPADKSKALGEVIAALAALESDLAPAKRNGKVTNIADARKRKAA